MIYSNLLGTTSNQFKVNGDGTGQILSNNAYDLFWGAHNTETNIQNPNIRYINNGTDMNDLLHYGQYSCYVSSTATTLVNRPTDYAFVMEVYPSVGAGTSYITQKVTDLLCNVYLRKYDGVWTAWKQVAYTSDIPTIERGTFTPTPFKPEGYSFTRLVQCNYIKILNQVTLIFDITVTVIKDGTTFAMSGLPYFIGDSSTVIGFVMPSGNLGGNTYYLIPDANYWSGAVDFTCSQIIASNNASIMPNFGTNNILASSGRREVELLGWCSYIVK